MERIIKTEIESICGGKSCLKNLKPINIIDLFDVRKASHPKNRINWIYLNALPKMHRHKLIKLLCNLWFGFRATRPQHKKEQWNKFVSGILCSLHVEARMFNQFKPKVEEEWKKIIENFYAKFVWRVINIRFTFAHRTESLDLSYNEQWETDCKHSTIFVSIIFFFKQKKQQIEKI